MHAPYLTVFRKVIISMAIIMFSPYTSVRMVFTYALYMHKALRVLHFSAFNCDSNDLFTDSKHSHSY